MTDNDHRDRSPTSEIGHHLKFALLDLAANPYPDVPNPPGNGKRASVAVVIRVQPTYSYWPARGSAPDIKTGSPQSPGKASERLEAFFAQEWVQHGDPEVLFIRRAARAGDRWTSHVALPGGRRDPEDMSDQDAAIRETMEEVGIDLSKLQAIPVGNLPQRVVTTSWGKVPLMVLCPYIFLLTQEDAPTLRLQPTEVASAHWVPFRALLASSQRTYEFQDVSNRFARQEVGIKRWFFRIMLGRMLFAAIRLIPSQSQYCSSVSDFIPTEPIDPRMQVSSFKPALSVILSGGQKGYMPSPSEKPLLLWGLTLGVMADFLELLPPHTALELWTYPTFTPWDVRFTLWAMSYRFRQQKKLELSTDGLEVENVSQTMPSDAPISVLDSNGDIDRKPAEVGIGGLGAGIYYDKIRQCQVSRQGAISVLLEGYYDIVRRAVTTVLLGRISAAALVGAFFWSKYKRT